MNINIASTTSWLCDAGKDDRGRRVERGFRTRTRLTKSLQNLLWDTIEPQSTHPMAPGRLAASLGRYLGARPKHVFLVAQRGSIYRAGLDRQGSTAPVAGWGRDSRAGRKRAFSNFDRRTSV